MKQWSMFMIRERLNEGKNVWICRKGEKNNLGHLLKYNKTLQKNYYL